MCFPGSLVWIWQSCLPGVCFPWTVGLDLAVLLTWCVFSLNCWSGSGSPAYLLCVFPELLVWIWQSCLPGVCFPWTVGLDLAVLLTWCVFSLDCWSGSGSPAYLVCVFPGLLVWIWQSCLPGVCFPWTVGLDPAVLL